MTINEMMETINQTIEEMIEGMEKIAAGDFGLDSRCGYIYINEEAIAVKLSADRTLQYYGGFEYVEEENRIAVGDYVFYSADSGRVMRTIENYMEGKE